MVKAWRRGTRPDFSQCFHLLRTSSISASPIGQDAVIQEGTNNVASKREAHVVHQGAETHVVNYGADTNVVNHGAETHVVSADDEYSNVFTYYTEGFHQQHGQVTTPTGTNETENRDVSTCYDISEEDSHIGATKPVTEDGQSLTVIENYMKYRFSKDGDDLSKLPDTFSVRKSIHTYHHERRRTSTDGPFSSGHVRFPSAVTSDVMEKMRPYLGKVFVKDAFVGSCLAVGEPDHPSVITCFHVIENGLLLPPLPTLEDIRVKFEDTHRLKSETMKACVEKDYAIMELSTDERLSLPPTWRKFGCLSSHDQPIFMIGFQKGILNIDDSAVILNSCPFTLIDKAQRRKGGYSDVLTKQCDSICAGKTLVQSFMYHGGSGGVGVTVDNDELQVVLMFQRGFPNQYYKEMDLGQKMRFESHYLIEQGMTFSEIYNDVSAVESLQEHKAEYMNADILFDGLSGRKTPSLNECHFENIRRLNV